VIGSRQVIMTITFLASSKMHELLGPGFLERWTYWQYRSQDEVSIANCDIVLYQCVKVVKVLFNLATLFYRSTVHISKTNYIDYSKLTRYVVIIIIIIIIINIVFITISVSSSFSPSSTNNLSQVFLAFALRTENFRVI